MIRKTHHIKRPTQPFKATHRIMWIDRAHELSDSIAVMLVGTAAFTRGEWNRGEKHPAWSIRGRRALFHGVTHDHWTIQVQKVTGRRGGSKPKRGTPGRNRTIRVPDEIWAKFQAAARQAGTNVTDWLLKAADRRLDAGVTR